MKRKLLILFLCYNVWVSAPQAAAQEFPNTAINTLRRVENMAQEPATDILKQTLKQAEENKMVATTIETANISPSDSSTDIKEIRDPFTPQIPQEAKPALPIATTSIPNIVPEQATPVPQFIVSGMIWNSKKPAAIVNDQVVAIGDQISNWAVTQITKDGINMTFEQQNLWIKPIVNPELGAQAQPSNPYRR
jgi:hypothetical protein